MIINIASTLVVIPSSNKHLLHGMNVQLTIFDVKTTSMTSLTQRFLSQSPDLSLEAFPLPLPYKRGGGANFRTTEHSRISDSQMSSTKKLRKMALQGMQLENQTTLLPVFQPIQSPPGYPSTQPLATHLPTHEP